jgi:hypothetical protein
MPGPYALALFLAVIMLYGFARAVRQGDRVGRWLFIAGGAALCSTHYVLILVAAGVHRIRWPMLCSLSA